MWLSPVTRRALSRQPQWLIALLFCSVLISRLPFLDAGYGVNIDGWRVARVAREIANTGHYTVSRFPGNPLQEITCSLVWRGGPWALNGLSACFSAVAVSAFAVLARKLGCRDWFIGALAFSAIPEFFVASVGAKDYVWALALVLLSLAFASYSRSLLAALFLGLATGCRITSLAMLLPIAFIVFDTGNVRRVIAFTVVSLFSAVLAFSPVWLRYGKSFLTFYENHAPADWLTVLHRATVELWGGIGVLAIVVVALVSIFFTRRRHSSPSALVVSALLVIIAIYSLAYVRLPDQAGYLLPIAPATLLLALLFAPRRLVQISCGCMLIAPFLDLSPHGVVPGAAVIDRQQRLRTMTNIRNFVSFAESLPGRNIFVVGAWEPPIAVMAPRLVRGRNQYLYLMNALEVKEAQAKGANIFYLPAIREFNHRINDIDLAQFGARDVHVLYQTFLAGRTAP